MLSLEILLSQLEHKEILPKKKNDFTYLIHEVFIISTVVPCFSLDITLHIFT
jgi:hypothetical protein